MDQVLQLIAAGVTAGCIYAVIALSFEIAYEATGVVNFATGHLVTLGALIGISTVGFGAGPSGSYVVVMAAMAVVGLTFFVAGYWPLRHRDVIIIIIGTVAIGIFIQNVGLLIWGALPRSLPSPAGGGTFVVGGVPLAYHTLYVVVATAVLIGLVYVLLYRSSFGRQMRALAQDPDAARLMGIRVNVIYGATWVIVCGMAGLAGLLLAPMWFVDVTLGDSLALKAFAAAVIGGFGSIPGAIIGGLLVGLTEILAGFYITSQFKEAIVFLLMVAFLVVRPQGIFGERISDKA